MPAEQAASEVISALQQGVDWAIYVMFAIAALGLTISFIGWLINRS